MSVAITIDVEPDWGCKGDLSAERAVSELAEWFAARDLRVTWFWVANLASRHRHIVRALTEAGHEIGSHGLTHLPLKRVPLDVLDVEVIESKKVLEDVLGAGIKGFRAPYLAPPRAMNESLRDAGYLYDSSLGPLFPFAHFGRGPNLVTWRDVVSLPSGTLRDGVTPFSMTWFRLWPGYCFRLLPQEGVFFMHAHEFLPEECWKDAPMMSRLMGRNVGEKLWPLLDRLIGHFPPNGFKTCAELAEGLEAQGEKTL